MKPRHLGVFTVLVVAVIAAGVGAVSVTAHPGHDGAHQTDNETSGQAAGTTNLCEFPKPEWREAMTVAGVDIQESDRCRPDNPYAVASSVKGTNNVPMDVLMKSGYAMDTVKKCCDRDGDGDPDVIRITLEVNELNTESGSNHPIAPGVNPSMWVFSPKTQGMVTDPGAKAARVVRAPSPAIRVEEGDTVYVEVENTHYFPHTIHFHGVDHPYETNKTGTAGNDGVPQTSESPIMPGDSRVYKFTPEEPGSMFYHCHVVPNVHIQMGLSGMFTIVENTSDNNVQTLNNGAGKVRHPSESLQEEGYEQVYDMQYQAMDKDLTQLLNESDDPQELATAVNREYDTTDGSADYYLLNGRSFPYTVQESIINVEPNENYRINVLNTGLGDVALHTHGHKFTIEAYDGVAVNESNEIQRDVVDVAPAQRVTLNLNTTNNGLDSYGKGVWFMHGHHEPAVTTDGISPGGNVNLIVYDEYVNENGMPETNTNMGKFFNKSYYDGEVPFWTGLDGKLAEGNNTSTATLDAINHWWSTGGAEMNMQMTDNGGMVVNENTDRLPLGCSEIQNTRNITVKAGEKFAEEGEMFAYNKSEYEFDTCTKVTVTLVNTDEVRHQWMVHGLPSTIYPGGMFNIEADGGDRVTATFITPGQSGTFNLHCSVPKHESMGMHETIVVGDPATGQQGDGETNNDDLPVVPILGGIGAVAAVSGVAYAVYRMRNEE